MIDQLDSAPALRAAVSCDICHTPQPAPTTPGAAWRCKKCGQQYRSTSPSGENSISLSEPQLIALRSLGARDPSGNSNIVPNWWTQNDKAVGKDFLDYNKDKPARQFTRKLIFDWASTGQISSVLEIAFGGLHEYRAMRSRLRELSVSYAGIDWTEHFVAHAQQEFPECRWNQGDIVRGVLTEGADVVYSQHLLEHLPALEPAFSNMLRLAGKKFINMFFIPPKPFENYEVVNWQHYPLYHNTYSIGHVEKILRANNFTWKWIPFPNNPADPQRGGLGEDIVLVAERS